MQISAAKNQRGSGRTQLFRMATSLLSWAQAYESGGYILCVSGSYSEAEPILRQALQYGLQFYSPTHPWTLRVRGNLNLSVEKLENSKRALRVLGNSNPMLENSTKAQKRRDAECTVCLKTRAVVLVLLRLYSFISYFYLFVCYPHTVRRPSYHCENTFIMMDFELGGNSFAKQTRAQSVPGSIA